MVKKLYILICLMAVSLLALGQESLTLDECRERVIEYNPTLKQQEKLVESAEANIKANKKDYYPTIDVSGDYTFLQNPIMLETETSSSEGPQNLYGLYAPIIQKVYRGNSVRKANEMAGLEMEFASDNRENVEDYLLLQTELAFWDAIYNEELLKLVVSYEKVIDDLAAVIEDKVANEIISRNDLLLVEVRQNEAELFRLVTTNQLDVSLMELNRIIRSPLDQMYQLQGNLDEIVVTGMDYSLDSVLINRPDLAAQSKRVDMQLTNAELVKSQYLPSLYVGIVPSWGAPNTNIGLSDPNYNTSFMAGVNIPITRWGKKKQDVGREMFKAEAASYELEELQDEVKLDINSSSYQLAESIRRIELTKASLEKAQENLLIMTDRYLEGLSSILEVLDAQLYWQRAYKEMLDAQVYYKRAFAYYKQSIGQI